MAGVLQVLLGLIGFLPELIREIAIFPTPLRPPWSTGEMGIAQSLCLRLRNHLSAATSADLTLSYNSPHY